MRKDTKNYLLYSNKDQEKLYAIAHSKEEIKEVSSLYTEGVWFEYDVEIKEGHADVLFNEKLYKGRPKFADEPIVKEEKKEEKEKHRLHSGIGDLR
jgi:hypothetical protein